jgi:acylphosphatase
MSGAGLIRRRYILSGEVQGVGFRYRARVFAEELGVTGWVENQWDGTVVMEAQGTWEQLYRLIRELQEARFIEISRIDKKTIPVEEHEYYFEVR